MPNFATLGEIRNECRLVFKDEAQGYSSDNYLTDEGWNRLINQAQVEAVRAGRLITDASTGSVCSVTVTMGNPWVTTHSSILLIRRMSLSSSGYELIRIGVADMDHQFGMNWRNMTGIPVAYIPDMETGKVLLYPKPSANDSLSLVVERLPLTGMVNDSDPPELREEHRPLIVEYALYLAWRIDDTETGRPDRMNFHLAEFTRRLKQADMDKGYREGSPATTRMNTDYWGGRSISRRSRGRLGSRW